LWLGVFDNDSEVGIVPIDVDLAGEGTDLQGTDCPDCDRPCNCGDGFGPEEFEVTIDGVERSSDEMGCARPSAPDCGCEEINGVYVAPRELLDHDDPDSEPQYECRWIGETIALVYNYPKGPYHDCFLDRWLTMTGMLAVKIDEGYIYVTFDFAAGERNLAPVQSSDDCCHTWSATYRGELSSVPLAANGKPDCGQIDLLIPLYQEFGFLAPCVHLPSTLRVRAL
jgi:hypothetical protein